MSIPPRLLERAIYDAPEAYSYTCAANKPLWFERQKRRSVGLLRKPSKKDKSGLRRAPDGGGRFSGGNNFKGGKLTAGPWSSGLRYGAPLHGPTPFGHARGTWQAVR